MRNIIIGAVIVLALGGGAYAISQRDTSSDSGAPHRTSAQETPPSDAETAPTDTGSPLNVTVSANDNSASPDTINAAPGQTVNLTFKITNEGTYYGGMQFKSDDPVIDTGTIPGGQSKTITFKADKSFKFTPYWPQSSVKKDYLISVNVQ